MPGWSTPVKSLDAVSLSGTSTAGTTIDLHDVKTGHAMEVLADEEVSGGNGGQAVLTLEGSLDGSNFYALASSYTTPTGLNGTVAALVVTSDKPARYVRCSGYNVQGSSTVTTWHTSGDD